MTIHIVVLNEVKDLSNIVTLSEAKDLSRFVVLSNAKDLLMKGSSLRSERQTKRGNKHDT